MRIKSLGVRNLRLFSAADFSSFSQLNLIYGPNASGKTSLLEAIYLLATARSFRTANMLELLRHGSDALQITAKVVGPQGREIALGLERGRDSLLLRAGGKRVHRASELAQWLPAQIIHPESHQLISGGPKGRRRFLDWGVFHVEPGFQALWRRYDKALKQRNAALRSRGQTPVDQAWNSELDMAGAEIDRMRRRYVAELGEIMPGFISAMMERPDFGLDYYPGWESCRNSLLQELTQTLAHDRRRGFTCSGPHRADLIFNYQGQPAAQVISRGQQKLLVIALFLAQAELLTRKTGRSSVLLFDDLAAELDTAHRQKVLAVLEGMAVQVFITALDKDAIQPEGADVKRFHVEHGRLVEMI
jgi:DNA replication and repair protein RecF